MKENLKQHQGLATGNEKLRLAKQGNEVCHNEV
jgi:hypothetical protein